MTDPDPLDGIFDPRARLDDIAEEVRARRRMKGMPFIRNAQLRTLIAPLLPLNKMLHELGGQLMIEWVPLPGSREEADLEAIAAGSLGFSTPEDAMTALLWARRAYRAGYQARMGKEKEDDSSK